MSIVIQRKGKPFTYRGHQNTKKKVLPDVKEQKHRKGLKRTVVVKMKKGETEMGSWGVGRDM